MSIKFLIVSLFLAVFCGIVPQAFAEELSPFTDVQFDSLPSVKVEFAEQMLYLIEVNGVKREAIMRFCEATYGERCQCQFSERFSSLLTDYGFTTDSDKTVRLRLYDISTHEVKDVVSRMTSENIEAIRANREFRGEAPCL